jgi:hypothetical protein
VDIQVANGHDLRHIDLRKSMVKRTRDAIYPVVPVLRAAITSLPSGGTGHTGLREKTARGVQVKVSVAGPRVGARLRVDPRLFPANAKSLPKRLEGIGRWRHPVWGNTDVWVNQESHPYFYRTLLPFQGHMKTEITKILADTAEAAGFH